MYLFQLVQGADFQLKDKRGNSPLSAALQDGNEVGFEVILSTSALNFPINK